MGKGSNASKIAKAREIAAKRDAKGVGGGGAEGMAKRKGGLGLLCAICKSAFAENQAKRQLMEHVDAKHPKMTFPECFPGYEEEEA